jgi:hypothetical protein
LHGLATLGACSRAGLHYGAFGRWHVEFSGNPGAQFVEAKAKPEAFQGGVSMFSKDRFIQLIKQANVIHWDAQKSKMTPLITLIPANGFFSKSAQINIQKQIWPVVADPVWQVH